MATAHAISGAVAGAVSLSLFYPLDQLRTWVQVSDDDNNEGALRQAIKEIRRRGAMKLYAGAWAMVGIVVHVGETHHPVADSALCRTVLQGMVVVTEAGCLAGGSRCEGHHKGVS